MRQDVDLLAFRHPDRQRMCDEAAEMVRLGKLTATTALAQVDDLSGGRLGYRRVSASGAYRRRFARAACHRAGLRLRGSLVDGNRATGAIAPTSSAWTTARHRSDSRSAISPSTTPIIRGSGMTENAISGLRDADRGVYGRDWADAGYRAGARLHLASVRYVCLSDRRSSPFPYRHVPVTVPSGLSAQLYARQLKILADHEALEGADVLLWHDAAFRLTLDPAMVARQTFSGARGTCWRSGIPTGRRSRRKPPRLSSAAMRPRHGDGANGALPRRVDGTDGHHDDRLSVSAALGARDGVQSDVVERRSSAGATAIK